MAAINTQIGCAGAGCAFAVVTFETFVFRDPAPLNFPQAQAARANPQISAFEAVETARIWGVSPARVN